MSDNATTNGDRSLKINSALGVPQTLFALAGVKEEPASFADAVLVIVDTQYEYIDGALPLGGVEDAITEIARLLAHARTLGTAVIHVVHRGAGVLFNPTSHGFGIVEALHPRNEETIIEKQRVSAFVGTDLEKTIRRSAGKMILAGFMTHTCISSTARSARDLGIAPTVVASATATRDLPDGKGGVIGAAVLQAASLAILSDRIAVVVDSAEAIVDGVSEKTIG